MKVIWKACQLAVGAYTVAHLLHYLFPDKLSLKDWLILTGILSLAGLWVFRPVPQNGKRDTVIYFLRNGRSIVYVGIAFQNRAENRVAEHRRSGKVFNRVEWSQPMSRSKALSRERKFIQSLQPYYNIQSR